MAPRSPAPTRPANMLKALKAGVALVATTTDGRRCWWLSTGWPVDDAAATTLLATNILGGRLQPSGDHLPGFGAECSQTWRWQKSPPALPRKRGPKPRPRGPARRSNGHLQLGSDQRHALSNLAWWHGFWRAGCGWHIGGAYRTRRVMESLARRRLVQVETSNDSPGQTWSITAAGRAAIAALTYAPAGAAPMPPAPASAP